LAGELAQISQFAHPDFHQLFEAPHALFETRIHLCRAGVGAVHADVGTVHTGFGGSLSLGNVPQDRPCFFEV
jgi:hypothetical protein